MNCNTFEQRLDDYAAGQLDAKTLANCDQHVHHCENCQRALKIHQAYLQRVRAFAVPEPDPGRLAHLLAVTPELAQTEHRLTPTANNKAAFFKGFAAASLLACVIAGLSIYSNQTPGPIAEFADSESIIDVDLSKEVVVAIHVPDAIPAAQLALELPDNLRIQGQEALDLIAWSVDLEKGANVLRLPLRIRAGTDLAEIQRIAATLIFADQSKQFDLEVNLSSPIPSRKDAAIDGTASVTDTA